MLDEKRIKEAQSNIKSYLVEGLMTKQLFDKKIFDVLSNNAHESLETANFLSKNNKSPLWIIVCSYYSMFYIANAVLYKIGYKVGDKIAHKVTSDALIVFVKDKLKQSLIEDYEEAKEEALLLAKSRAESVIENFDFERKKRSFIQYQTKETEKTSKSQTSLNRAKEFMAEMEKLLL
jgi:hypothetical protein